jgi:hypothetical protein
MVESAARYEATPPSLAIERTERGYVAIGDSAAVAARAARMALLAVLTSSNGVALGAKSLFEAAAVHATTGREVLEAMVRDGEVSKSGAGKKGDPYVYCLDSAGTQSPKRTNECAGDL